MVPDAIRFYAGAPLVTSGGHRVGMLCVADAAPRAGFDAQAAAILANMAELVMREMELAASAALMHERQVPDSFSWHFFTINTGREGAVSRGACAAAAARLCPVQHTGCCEGPLLEPGRRAGRGSRRACRRRRRPVALPARACPAGDRHALHSAGAPGRKSPGRKSRSWRGGGGCRPRAGCARWRRWRRRTSSSRRTRPAVPGACCTPTRPRPPRSASPAWRCRRRCGTRSRRSGSAPRCAAGRPRLRCPAGACSACCPKPCR